MVDQAPSPSEMLAPDEAMERLLQAAKSHGAESADGLAIEGISRSVTCRGGRVEDLQESGQRDICLRVITDHRQAIVSTSDFRPRFLDELAERAVKMARQAPQDPNCGLIDSDLLLVGPAEDLDLSDDYEPDPDSLKNMAIAAEEAALNVEGVTKAEGAGAGWDSGTILLATSSGFRGGYARTSFSTSVSAIAGDGLSMERDYDYSTSRWLEDLKSSELVGAEAGERAVRRLNPRKVSSTVAPVIFEPRVANSLLRHLSSAINGQAIARGTSFLREKMGTALFTPGVNIIDDPGRRRGLRSKPFDGEGMETKPLAIIEAGELKTWILDGASARKLSLASNGRASRGIGTPPAPSATNLYMEPGEITPEDMIKGVKSGLLVTELIGMGVNTITGDYSRGATGLWIENGEIAYPVSEITIAGNLLDIFAAITPASDLEFRYGTDAPTLLVDSMTIAGN